MGNQWPVSLAHPKFLPMGQPASTLVKYIGSRNLTGNFQYVKLYYIIAPQKSKRSLLGL